jgi:hypothetical protein
MRRCGHRVNYPLIRSTPDADGKDLPKREASENPPLEPVTAASKELSTTGIWAHTSKQLCRVPSNSIALTSLALST